MFFITLILMIFGHHKESEKCFIDCCLEELEVNGLQVYLYNIYVQFIIQKREKIIVGAKAMYKHTRDIIKGYL